MLLNHPTVVQDLKLTDSQKSRVQRLLQENRPANWEPGQGPPPRPTREQQEAAKKQLKSILTEAQYQRFGQIEIQAMGPGAFFRPDVAEKLALTDEQKDRIESILENARPEPGQPPRPEAREEVNRRVLAVLDDGQRAKWRELTGKTLDLRPTGPPRGF